MRYLWGSVSGEWIDEHLSAQRQAGSLLSFDTRAPADLVVGPSDTWDTLRTSFPEGWAPDALVLYLPYRSIPQLVWSAPIPIIGLAGDWNLQWHAYRRLLRRCDLVLTDTTGAEVMRREGIEDVRTMNLFGLGRSWLEFVWPDKERDIDVLFVGNVHPAVQRERLPWLARLAALRPRWNVVITSGVFGDDYRRLLARTRIVFNRSIRGECNNRVAEAVAAGALLFQEAGNAEVQELLRDRQDCVLYDDNNLEALLDHYLRSEEERQAIADNARRLLPELSFSRQWDAQVSLIAADLPVLRQRAEKRCAEGVLPDVGARTWTQLSCSFGADPALKEDLTRAIQEQPRDPHLYSAKAVGIDASESVVEAANGFQQAWSADPRHVVAGLNLAEILVSMKQAEHADEQASRTLAMLDELREVDAGWLDAAHYPTGYDEFRVEWERAAWMHAGQPDLEAQAKVVLLRWRLHGLLAQLRDDVVHAFIAQSLCPDLPISQAVLGCALARKGRFNEAVGYLRDAVAGNPFDLDAARALYETLNRLGLSGQRERLAERRRRLSAAAPRLLPAEPWFAERTLAVLSSEATSNPLRIAWHGSQEAVHSLALVNREICVRLAERGHELSLLPSRYEDPPGQRVPLPAVLKECKLKRLVPAADCHVGHQWPPDFSPPRDGHWIINQPWEFGSVPRAWIEPMTQLVDEIWVPSHHVRDGFVRSGIPPEQVHVVPNGVSRVFFEDNHRLYPLQTKKRFKFLFVGGTIERKGIDLLLKAYTQTFSDKDDVCLVIKDMGVGTFYQGQTAEQMIGQLRQAPHAPEIEYLSRELSDEEMAGLYAACDCLAHPYRAEGFGLPIAEAMACGLPVIVTGQGAVHHDRKPHSAHVDVVHDLEVLPWPWRSESCDEILGLDVFEHLHRMPEEWLRECHRILKPGGILRLRVPIFGSPWHLIDPTHVRGFHPLNFDYFIRNRELYLKYGHYYFDFFFSDAAVQIEEFNIIATLKK